MSIPGAGGWRGLEFSREEQGLFSQNSAGAHDRIIGKGGMLTAVLAKNPCLGFYETSILLVVNGDILLTICHSYLFQ